MIISFFGSTELHSLRYDERTRRMDPGFPRLIQADWPGIPRKVNAALKPQGQKKNEKKITLSLIFRTAKKCFTFFCVNLNSHAGFVEM